MPQCSLKVEVFFLSLLNSLFVSLYVLLFCKVTCFPPLSFAGVQCAESLLPLSCSCPPYYTHWLPSEAPLPLPYLNKTNRLDPTCKRTHVIFVFWLLLLSVVVWFEFDRNKDTFLCSPVWFQSHCVTEARLNSWSPWFRLPHAGIWYVSFWVLFVSQCDYLYSTQCKCHRCILPDVLSCFHSPYLECQQYVNTFTHSGLSLRLIHLQPKLVNFPHTALRVFSWQWIHSKELSLYKAQPLTGFFPSTGCPYLSNTPTFSWIPIHWLIFIFFSLLHLLKLFSMCNYL